MKTNWIGTAAQLHMQQANRGTWEGRANTPYFEACKQMHWFSGCVSLFTRDVGYHSSGWWKNPDYERCFHLTLSFFDVRTQSPMPKDAKITRQFVEALYGPHKRWVWCEPPYSDHGKANDVWHYRLFCNKAWQPIMPRGEVYSRELTEAGWMSFSDVQERESKDQRKRLERMLNG